MLSVKFRPFHSGSSVKDVCAFSFHLIFHFIWFTLVSHWLSKLVLIWKFHVSVVSIVPEDDLVISEARSLWDMILTWFAEQNLLICITLYYPYHRGEVVDISVTDLQWYCTKRNGFKYFNHSSFDYHYMHQLWNYIYYMYISSKIYQYCSTLNLYNLCYRSIRHCNADYSGLEWSNINTIWPRCG